ncbi:hypothetical protein L596_012270 [Steinernema carpocapsae]|uniref:Uncharacterized protein n=1 Tax=Steinernema carpocapsae TaxID=34508 RepID=A0A4V6A4R7_STECR|nr:hypothetical protein L596_012270 [Steinernema carpocapsae]
MRIPEKKHENRRKEHKKKVLGFGSSLRPPEEKCAWINRGFFRVCSLFNLLFQGRLRGSLEAAAASINKGTRVISA